MRGYDRQTSRPDSRAWALRRAYTAVGLSSLRKNGSDHLSKSVLTNGPSFGLFLSVTVVQGKSAKKEEEEEAQVVSRTEVVARRCGKGLGAQPRSAGASCEATCTVGNLRPTHYSTGYGKFCAFTLQSSVKHTYVRAIRQTGSPLLS